MINGKTLALALLTMLVPASFVSAQTLTTTMRLAPDQIGQIRTAQGISTKISFPDPIKEIICGDLYDPGSGTGNFVVQRSGNDVFLKPIGPKGTSNLFVKTGTNDEQTYGFDLSIVPVVQAHRIVNVLYVAPPGRPQPQQQAEDIIRNAQLRAGQIIAEAMDYANSRKREGREMELSFAQALLEVREMPVDNPRVVGNRVAMIIDQRLLVLKDKVYLRYVLQNTGNAEIVFSSVSLESTSGNDSRPVSIQVVQSKAERRLNAGETLTSVLVFDQETLRTREQLRLSIRNRDNAEIAYATINKTLVTRAP